MVLENIGTAEAQRSLQMLAGGAPPARVTQAAREALKRIKKLTSGGG
jgi:hypothetical protein